MSTDTARPWNVGDEALTRSERERVTLIERRLRLLPPYGALWIVRLSRPITGPDHVQFPVDETNLLVINDSEEDYRRALAERIWRKILTTYRVLDHEGCETGPDDPGDCGLFTLIYDELDGKR